jgi:hypothetical protein
VSNLCLEFDRFWPNSWLGENRGKCTLRIEVQTICTKQPSSTPGYYKLSGPGVWVRFVDNQSTVYEFRAWWYIFVALSPKSTMEASISPWMIRLDLSIGVTYYGFACHLQVVVNLNRESWILEHNTWRSQHLQGVLPIALLQYGLYPTTNPLDYESSTGESWNCRLRIIDDLTAESPDQSKIVKFCAAARTWSVITSLRSQVDTRNEYCTPRASGTE